MSLANYEHYWEDWPTGFPVNWRGPHHELPAVLCEGGESVRELAHRARAALSAVL